MTPQPFLLLFVDSPAASAAFYARLLGREPVESSPTFAMFALGGGARLGLWSRHTAEPRPDASPGSAELALAVQGDAEVERLHAAWRALGVETAQAPVRMDFGLTFLAQDPDGHRLRVFALG